MRQILESSRALEVKYKGNLNTVSGEYRYKGHVKKIFYSNVPSLARCAACLWCHAYLWCAGVLVLLLTVVAVVVAVAGASNTASSNLNLPLPPPTCRLLPAASYLPPPTCQTKRQAHMERGKQGV